MHNKMCGMLTELCVFFNPLIRKTKNTWADTNLEIKAKSFILPAKWQSLCSKNSSSTLKYTHSG